MAHGVSFYEGKNLLEKSAVSGGSIEAKSSRSFPQSCPLRRLQETLAKAPHNSLVARMDRCGLEGGMEVVAP